MLLFRPGLSTLVLGLALDTASGSDVLHGTISDGAKVFAMISADRAAYSVPTNPAPPALARRYTAAFPARSSAQTGIGPSGFPQGDGVAIASVQTNGSMRITGRLADGSRVALSSALSKENTFPLHVTTDRNRGSLSGLVTFRDLPGVSDFDSADLAWFKSMDLSRKIYPSGWPGGIGTDLVGSAFVGQPALPGLSPPSPEGNAVVSFSGVGIGTILEKSLNIDPRSRARVIGIDDDRLKLRLSGKVGAFGAVLKDAAGHRRVRGLGVILQKQRLGTGFFIEDGRSGGILLRPRTP